MSENYTRDDAHLRRIIFNEKENFKSYRQQGIKFATDIAELLKHEPGLSVARCFLGGSVGKRTSLGANNQPDFDVVIFLNGIDLNAAKPLARSLEIIERVIKERSLASFHFKYKSEFAVGCVQQGTGIKLDFVPAVNFHRPHLGGSSMGVQLKACLEALPGLGSRQKYLSSSMTEAAVHYIASQSDFVRGVIILAKLWKTNKLDGKFGRMYVAGLASVVELVAVKAAQEEIERAETTEESPSYALALIGFLRIFTLHVQEVQVYFQYDLPVKSAQLRFQEMKNQERILLDPVNPYNNFLDGANVSYAWDAIIRSVAQKSAKLFFLHNQRLTLLEEDMSLLNEIIY